MFLDSPGGTDGPLPDREDNSFERLRVAKLCCVWA